MWHYHRLQTPLGEIFLGAEQGVFNRVYLPGQAPELIATHWQPAPELLDSPAQQILEYLSGQRREFKVSYQVKLSDFQRAVLKEVTQIPYGQTRTYQDIATRLGKPDVVRAVGAANGKNPLPIIIPCHRVVGSTGQLVGYAGGLKLKKTLLDLESSQMSLGFSGSL